MLKKLSVALCVASIFGCGVASADDKTTATGQISFVGTVTKTAPTIVVVTQDSEFGLDNSASNVISLGDYTFGDLEEGEFLDNKAVPFQIVMRSASNLNHVSEATLKIEASHTGGVIHNSLTGATAASNVGVALHYYGTGTSPVSNGAFFNSVANSRTLETVEFDHGTTDPMFNFKAGLQKIGSGHMTPGDVKATIQVTLEYN